ncbi:DUF4435 domain-containing protein [Flavobacterium sp.]|uniref:DUF4435 domain-containing protein n=1 Tax=Flavobacterium sp. TaxID=239 RepID=UPI0025BD5259|nr:DUF4435 domain-containing protein [Flavobacterium sp.]MBA4155729.1 hypothetical protein [Flavobacterium sp.]
MEFGFPELTESFLSGQDVFYVQFNDVFFYVEDTDQEHLYYNILKRLFPDVKFDKIFPLNGKQNLKNHAKLNVGDNKKVYIADLDFEDILETKENIDNVFYLKKYSIENYLIDKQGIYEIIREKNPKLKNANINALFSLLTTLNRCKSLSELSRTFIVIQKFSLGKEYFGLNPARDFDFATIPPSYKNSFITNYFDEVEILLKSIDARFTLNSKTKIYKSSFKSLDDCLSNIPGKHLLVLIKFLLEKEQLINQVSLETFTYKLSKDCSVDSFNDLKDEILEFVA